MKRIERASSILFSAVRSGAAGCFPACMFCEADSCLQILPDSVAEARLRTARHSKRFEVWVLFEELQRVVEKVLRSRLFQLSTAQCHPTSISPYDLENVRDNSLFRSQAAEIVDSLPGTSQPVDSWYRTATRASPPSLVGQGRLEGYKEKSRDFSTA
jgi:hypothetical protein